MKIFLTSSIGGSYVEDGVRKPSKFDESNGFIEKLKAVLPDNAKCLIIASDPNATEINDFYKLNFAEAFKLSGFALTSVDFCDSRNMSQLSDYIYDYQLLILAGGHVPTQNKFFQEINLRELLKTYNGIVIGISAGTMNSASVVYAQPELEGEAIDASYNRYLEGLNLTNINVLPHFQELKDMTLDGLSIVEDISLADSKVRPFYALIDGSYIFIENNNSTLFGEAYLVKEGIITKICEINASKKIADLEG